MKSKLSLMLLVAISFGALAVVENSLTPNAAQAASVPEQTTDTQECLAPPECRTVRIGNAFHTVCTCPCFVETINGVVEEICNAPDAAVGEGRTALYPNERYRVVPNGVDDMEVADMTGDGLVDVVITSARSDEITLLVADGAGSFLRERRFDIGTRPNRVTIADVLGDENLDVVTTTDRGNNAVVLVGDGVGGLAPPLFFPAGGERKEGVAVADVSGDGLPDIVTTNPSTNDVSVLLADGAGGFSKPAEPPPPGGGGEPVDPMEPAPLERFVVGDNPVDVEVMDVTGDGRPDIVVVNQGSDDVSVLTGDGVGSFTTEIRIPVGDGPNTVTVADLTGDGRLDIVTTNFSSDDVSLVVGTAVGLGFVPEQRLMVGVGPTDLEVADVDADGRADLIVTNQKFVNTSVTDGTSNDVSVLIADDAGGFAAQRRFFAINKPTQVAAADVTGDGVLDVLTANDNGPFLAVTAGDGSGGFVDQQRFDGRAPVAAAVADMTGDGLLDIVAIEFEADIVKVFDGDGSRGFAPPRRFQTGLNNTELLAVGDVSGDGQLDIVTGNLFSGGFPAGLVSVLVADGEGGFAEAQRVAQTGGTSTLLVADLTGDDIADIVIGDTRTDSVAVLVAVGDGDFEPIRRFALRTKPQGLAVADVSSDGIPDIVATNNVFGTGAPNEALVLIGDGEGGFAPPRRFSTGGENSISRVAIADMTSDGFPDIVAVFSTHAGGIVVLAGDGAGAFGPPQRTELISGLHMLIEDVSGDGLLDAVFGGASVLVGLGNGEFAQQLSFEAGPASGLAIADLDADGLPDIVVPNGATGSISVLFHQGGVVSVQDGLPPVGSVSIAGGAEVVNISRVVLNLAATDNFDAVTEMRVANGPSPAAAPWQPFAETLDFWTLEDGEGERVVSAQFRDAAGNESEVVTDSIIVDLVFTGG